MYKTVSNGAQIDATSIATGFNASTTSGSGRLVDYADDSYSIKTSSYNGSTFEKAFQLGGNQTSPFARSNGTTSIYLYSTRASPYYSCIAVPYFTDNSVNKPCFISPGDKMGCPIAAFSISYNQWTSRFELNGVTLVASNTGTTTVSYNVVYVKWAFIEVPTGPTRYFNFNTSSFQTSWDSTNCIKSTRADYAGLWTLPSLNRLPTKYRFVFWTTVNGVDSAKTYFEFSVASSSGYYALQSQRPTLTCLSGMPGYNNGNGAPTPYYWPYEDLYFRTGLGVTPSMYYFWIPCFGYDHRCKW